MPCWPLLISSGSKESGPMVKALSGTGSVHGEQVLRRSSRRGSMIALGSSCPPRNSTLGAGREKALGRQTLAKRRYRHQQWSRPPQALQDEESGTEWRGACSRCSSRRMNRDVRRIGRSRRAELLQIRL
ncbi:hypothetical protein PUN28_012869 [Cardiocondyla obscurior]|uniref:Uncharacterized protein n=1 Tax=Cardiocondyla obscurior TaxID=286306 RepID=A0AAW2F873_9HYME